MFRSLQTIFFGLAATAVVAAVAIFINGCAGQAAAQTDSLQHNGVSGLPSGSGCAYDFSNSNSTLSR